MTKYTNQDYQLAIALASSTTLEAAASVLVKEFGFTDDQTAKFLEATAAVMVHKMDNLKLLTEAAKRGR